MKVLIKVSRRRTKKHVVEGHWNFRVQQAVSIQLALHPRR